MNIDKTYAEYIANKYSVKETSKVMQLKKLHKKASRFVTIFAITFGTISSLVLGTGMSLAMGVLLKDDLALELGLNPSSFSFIKSIFASTFTIP